MENKDLDYGFSQVLLEDGRDINLLKTGDGKATFTDMQYRDGFAGVAFGYGAGVGVNVKFDNPETLDELNAEWMILFENPDSITSIIETLERTRANLVAGLHLQESE